MRLHDWAQSTHCLTLLSLTAIFLLPTGTLTHSFWSPRTVSVRRQPHRHNHKQFCKRRDTKDKVWATVFGDTRHVSFTRSCHPPAMTELGHDPVHESHGFPYYHTDRSPALSCTLILCIMMTTMHTLLREKKVHHPTFAETAMTRRR